MFRQPTDLLEKPPLAGLRVCISGAVPERKLWGDVPDLDRLILTFVAQLSALVVRYGGQVVHGSQPALTPVVAEQARRQSREGHVPLRLFASQLFGPVPEVTLNAARVARADVVLTTAIGRGGTKDPETVNQSLTAMRLTMMQDADVVVAIGGKLHTDTGFNPGVLEELAQARWHDRPCFVVGAFGGAVAQLEHPVLEELCVGNGFENLSPIIEMATWTETLDEYVGTLLTHLVRHAEIWARGRGGQARGGAPRQSFLLKEMTSLEGASAPVIEVDRGTAGAWQSRFAELRSCIERKDTARARKLLAEK
jgi:diadenosine tetraphosphatase ApaH/serine/threonine PP2A family protein phosphatase